MATSATKWMWVTLLAVFSLGVAGGVLLDRLLLVRTVSSSSIDGGSRAERHRHRGERFLARLRDELGLSPEQESALRKVLEKNHETAHDFWKQSRRQFEELRHQFREDIRELLTDSQRERFDAMLESYDAERRERDHK